MRKRFIVFVLALVLAATPTLAAASPTPTPKSLGDQLLTEARQVFNYMTQTEMTENNPWYDYLQAVLYNSSWGLVPSPAPVYTVTPTPTISPDYAYLKTGFYSGSARYIWNQASLTRILENGNTSSGYTTKIGGSPSDLDNQVYSLAYGGSYSSSSSSGASFYLVLTATESYYSLHLWTYSKGTVSTTYRFSGPSFCFLSTDSSSSSAIGQYVCPNGFSYNGSSSGLLSASKNSSGVYTLSLGQFTVPSLWLDGSQTWVDHELIKIYLNGEAPSIDVSPTQVPSVPIPEIVMPQRDYFPEGSEGDYYYDQSLSIYNRVIQMHDDLTINVPSMPYDSLVPDLDSLKDYKLFALPIQMAQDIYDTCISGYSSSFDFSLDIPENSILNFPDVSISLDPRTLFGSLWNFITYVFSFFAFLMLFRIIFNSVVGGNDNA